MFKNYLKITVRNLVKNKVYSSINIIGLAIGIASCLLIFLWVQKELSYDKFHKNAHRIYRVERELYRENAFSRWPITSGAYKQPLIDDFPEIENAVRFWGKEYAIHDSRGNIHRQAAWAVDNSIFQIFDFKLLQGDEQTALKSPYSLVLTREKAIALFGSADVVGKSLVFEWEDKPTEFKVAGILHDIPLNSHMQFNMLVSISSYPAEYFSNWRSNYLYTYVLLSKNVKWDRFEEKLKSFVSQRLAPFYGDLTHGEANIHEVLRMVLMPITHIHLHPSSNWEIQPGGNAASVFIFSSIALLILIIACINFINLSTARANKRAKEVGLRKSVGARNFQLQVQFILESILLSVISLVIALSILVGIVPLFNSFFHDHLLVESLFYSKNLALLLGFTSIVGLISGIYPAFYLTKFNPVEVFSRIGNTAKRKSGFRRNMVIVQFSISILLIVFMITIHRQMKYIQNSALGYDKKNVVLIQMRSQQVTQNYKTFRNALLQDARIQSVAASASIPGNRVYGNTNYSLATDHTAAYSFTNIFTDYDFADTYKLEFPAGRNFSQHFGEDTSWTILMNEAAARKFGWSPVDAVGKVLKHRNEKSSKIVGVVRDFNFRSMHTEIEPLIMLLSNDYILVASIRVTEADPKKTLNFIRTTWEQSFPGEEFAYSFLEDRLNLLYEGELRTQDIIMLFSSLSLFVACLGLFGLVTSIAEDRTKEIGIRKTLGASVSNILRILTKDISRWILLANVIAWPIAFFVIRSWLENFAYRIEVSIWSFALSGIAALIIALLTISWQAIRAALANPVDSLRYE